MLCKVSTFAFTRQFFGRDDKMPGNAVRHDPHSPLVPLIVTPEEFFRFFLPFFFDFQGIDSFFPSAVFDSLVFPPAHLMEFQPAHKDPPISCLDFITLCL